MPANAAIKFHPGAHTGGSGPIIGRLRAGSGFVNGFLEHADTESFYVHAELDAHMTEFRHLAAARDPKRRPVHSLSSSGLAVAGTLMLPDPALGKAARADRRNDPRRYSLCGVTHTLSSKSAIRAVGELLTTPVQPWDALVCTSQSARAVVVKIIEAQAERLASRTDAPPRPARCNCPSFRSASTPRPTPPIHRPGPGSGHESALRRTTSSS
ncbi:hypothetical protein [Thalassobaculum sp.]|uniref:hypothetical protein n=1 Tax=Thalassobaculum sp. TaxID=2022740 RepID=UPI0032ECA4EF